MAQFTIQQLFTAQTQDQWRSALVSALKGLGIRADQWIPGGVGSTMITVMAIMLATLSAILSPIIQGLFLPLSTGGYLQLLAQYWYGIPVTAFSATFATGEVTLVNSGGGVYNVAIGALTVSNPATGAQYTNTEAFVIPPKIGLVNGQVTVEVQATAVGTASNSNPNTVTNMVTTFIGVTCYNVASIVGTDSLTDDALRQLCLGSLGIRSVRGPRSAYEYAVQTAINSAGARVNVNRINISSASSQGVVSVLVASPAGVASNDDVSAIATNIFNIAQPQGITVNVSSTTTVPYVRTITVWASAPFGTSATTLQTACANALTLFFENYPIGGQSAQDDSGPLSGVLGPAVIAALASACAANGATLVSVTSNTGSLDLALLSTQVAIDETTLAPVRLLPTGLISS